MTDKIGKKLAQATLADIAGRVIGGVLCLPGSGATLPQTMPGTLPGTLHPLAPEPITPGSHPRLFLSGPMTILPDWNFPAFRARSREPRIRLPARSRSQAAQRPTVSRH